MVGKFSQQNAESFGIKVATPNKKGCESMSASKENFEKIVQQNYQL